MTSFRPSSSEIIQFNGIHNSYFLFIFLYWGVVASQHCANFCCTANQRISLCKHTPLSSGFSSQRGHHRAPSRVPCAIQRAFTSYLFDAQQCTHVNLHLPIYSMPLSPLGVHVFLIYICISITALQISSSVPFFQIPHIRINT